MAQYFENDSKLKSNENNIKVIINNEKFTFITDNGVFSKKGLDFGTRTLLESIDTNSIHGKVLDLGCGYGPIGIYISAMTDTKVDMVDVNLRSLKLAEKNSKLNNVNVNIFESNIYSNIKDKYDFIISNPPIRVGKEILYQFLFDAKNHLTENGTMYIVINKNQGAKTVLRDLNEIYSVEVINKNKGFYIISLKIN